MEDIAITILLLVVVWMYISLSNLKYSKREYYFLKNYYLVNENSNIEVVKSHRNGGYYIVVFDNKVKKYMFFKRSLDMNKAKKEFERRGYEVECGERGSDLPLRY